MKEARGVPRLVVLLSAALVIDGLFFTALAPLLPELRQSVGLSQFQAGVLTAMYPLGMLIASIPAALCSAHIGVKATVVIGLAMVGAMNVAFAFAHSFPALLAAQLVAGLGGACIWSGATVWLIHASKGEQRGEMIGFAQGASAIGEIVGPVVGGAATVTGRAPAFLVTAAMTAAVARIALGFPAPAKFEQRLEIRRAIGSSAIRSAAPLTLIAGVVIGALILLATLRLHYLGCAPSEIAIVFLVTAAVSVIASPLVGRWSDRRGRRIPLQLALLASGPLVLALAWTENRWVAIVLVVAALVAIRAYWGISLTLLSEASDSAGVGQVWALAVASVTGTAGFVVGATGGGAIANAAGTACACVVAAALLLLAIPFTMFATGGDRRSVLPGSLTARIPKA